MTREKTLRRMCLESPRINEIDFATWKKEIGAVEIHKMEEYFLSMLDKNIKVSNVSNSTIAYLIGITDELPKDAVVYKGGSMPDVDIDTERGRREDIMQYLRSKYGSEYVANIGTYNYMYAKSSVRMVGKALGYELAYVDELAKMIPDPIQGRNWSIDEAIEENPELAEAIKNDEKAQELFKWSRKLEGIISSKSKHAAGVVISDEPLNTSMATWRDGDQAILEFDMKAVEDFGYVKVDLLSLKTLDVIKETLRLVKERHNITIDYSNIDLEDKNIYKLLHTGDLLGVFQLEGKGISEFTKTLKPDKFDDIVLISAGYRPGPIDFMPSIARIKNGIGNPDVIPHAERFPLLKPFLSNSYGYLVYQEQISNMVQELAGYTDAEADEFRKIVAKKLRDKMEIEKSRFFPKAKEKGMTDQELEILWEELVSFASYSFNLSHAVSYSIITAKTAWLKYYYPVEFFIANILFESDDITKVMQLIVEAKKFKISVLPPDINISNNTFTAVDNNTIRFGLSGISGVGSSADNFIVERRNGNYKSLSDFILRTNPRYNVLENMIKAGAFDNIINRSQVFDIQNGKSYLERLVDFVKWNSTKNMKLLDASEEFIKPSVIPEYSIDEKISMEADITGLWLSDHPFNVYKDEIADFKSTNPNSSIGFITSHKKFRNSPGASFILQEQSGAEKLFFIFKDLWEGSFKTEKAFKEYYSYVVGVKHTRYLKGEKNKPIAESVHIIGKGTKKHRFPRRVILPLEPSCIDSLDIIKDIKFNNNDYINLFVKHKNINFSFNIQS